MPGDPRLPPPRTSGTGATTQPNRGADEAPLRQECRSRAPGRRLTRSPGNRHTEHRRRGPFLASRNRLAHHAVVHALWPVVAEAGPFEEGSGAVVEEGRRNLLANGVLRVRLHDATPRLRDQTQSTM